MSSEFDARGSKVFQLTEIRHILKGNEAFWDTPDGMTESEFIELLTQQTPLRRVPFEFPSRPETRYAWRNPDLLEIVLSLKPKGFLSHFTALSLHGLTDQIPKTIYLNHEQKRSPFQSRDLTQASLDTAFKRPCRVSKNIARMSEVQICILNSMGVDDLGIIDMHTDGGVRVRTTDLERTLIDATVRPIYAGGVHEVLGAYRRAADQVSANRLRSYLKRLDFVYPYHQAIGFYMDRAGNYKGSQIELMREMGLNFDFYLTHAMRDPAHDSKWRLSHPQGL